MFHPTVIIIQGAIMPRKAILEGGKRDEIIAAATELFFTEGFEKTSVRKILARVDGEIGMFYHYFASKEALFDTVIDRFFRQYAIDFESMTESISSADEFVELFLCSYEAAMIRYRVVEGAMHWTIRAALHERTLVSLLPTVEKLLLRLGYQGEEPVDLSAAILVGEISAVLHSPQFEEMDKEERRHLIKKLIQERCRL